MLCYWTIFGVCFILNLFSLDVLGVLVVCFWLFLTVHLQFQYLCLILQVSLILHYIKLFLLVHLMFSSFWIAILLLILNSLDFLPTLLTQLPNSLCWLESVSIIFLLLRNLPFLVIKITSWSFIQNIFFLLDFFLLDLEWSPRPFCLKIQK